MKEQNRDQEKQNKTKNHLERQRFFFLLHLKPYTGQWPTAAYGVHSAYFETRQKMLIIKNT